MITNKTAQDGERLGHEIACANLLVVPKDQFIVQMATDAFFDEIDPSVSIPNDVSVSGLLTEASSNLSKLQEMEIDRFITLTTNGLQAMVQRIQTLVVPAAKEVSQKIRDDIAGTLLSPKVDITAYTLPELLESPGFVEHLLYEYGNYVPLKEYRSVDLGNIDKATIKSWVMDNPHFDEHYMSSYFEKMDSDDNSLVMAFYCIFGSSILDIQNTPIVNWQYNPDGVILALYAYLMTGYLCKNPEAPENDDCTIEEWNNIMGGLHSYFGYLLTRIIKHRASMRKDNRMVLKIHRDGDGPTSAVVNPDVYNAWLAGGGSVMDLIGAMISNVQPNDIVPALFASEKAQNFTEVAERWYKRRKIAAEMGNTTRLTNIYRDEFTPSIVGQNISEDEKYKTLYSVSGFSRNDVEVALATEMSKFSYPELMDVERAVSKLICRIFFKHTQYEAFLKSMDDLSVRFPDFNADEVASLSMIAMAVDWFCSQFTLEPVELIPTEVSELQDTSLVEPPVEIEEVGDDRPEPATAEDDSEEDTSSEVEEGEEEDDPVTDEGMTDEPQVSAA